MVEKDELAKKVVDLDALLIEGVTVHAGEVRAMGC